MTTPEDMPGEGDFWPVAEYLQAHFAYEHGMLNGLLPVTRPLLSYTPEGVQRERDFAAADVIMLRRLRALWTHADPQVRRIAWDLARLASLPCEGFDLPGEGPWPAFDPAWRAVLDCIVEDAQRT